MWDQEIASLKVRVLFDRLVQFPDGVDDYAIDRFIQEVRNFRHMEPSGNIYEAFQSGRFHSGNYDVDSHVRRCFEGVPVLIDFVTDAVKYMSGHEIIPPPDAQDEFEKLRHLASTVEIDKMIDRLQRVKGVLEEASK